MASSSSSSSSCPVKHQVFLSFRGEDTRLNFTGHLLKALKDTGMNVFFDEDTLEKGEQLSAALSQAIAASNLSIIVLSKDYASSKSCLAELSDIVDRKRTQEHILLPIFYHVDPSHVRNIEDSFKTSFDYHESNGLNQLQRWKSAFAEVGKLKGWHIEGGKFDRSETEYIKDVVEYVIKKLNSKSASVSEVLVGIEDQKEAILRLIHEQEHIRVIGIWGMGGTGKTTLAEVVYNEISLNFESRCFLQNVREKIEKKGKESLRNELVSKLLNSETCIDTPSIGSNFTKERLKNKRVFVVLDDVVQSDQINYFGVKHFGDGSKVIITSRDRQVLENGGVDKIHEVEMLNDDDDSLQYFADAAPRIQNAFRVHSLEIQTKAIEASNSEDEARHIVAAMKIQHAFRNFETKTKMAAAVQIQHAFRKFETKKKMAAAVKIQHAFRNFETKRKMAAAVQIQHAFRNFETKTKMAAAVQIQYRFQNWKMRKEFLNLRRQAIKIQAAFRGFLTRKQYRKITWSVGVLEKADLQWRLKRKGLRGLQVNPFEDFYRTSRKQAEQRVEKAVVRVQAMFRSKKAQQDYRRMKLAHDLAMLEYRSLLDPTCMDA